MKNIIGKSISNSEKHRLKGMLFLGITVMCIMIAYNLVDRLG